jgi:hypothetical protein
MGIPGLLCHSFRRNSQQEKAQHSPQCNEQGGERLLMDLPVELLHKKVVLIPVKCTATSNWGGILFQIAA